MRSIKAITIVGGGLAGLTLGIALRQRECPVTIWEAGGYPRHRVCGEYISGNGQGVLQRLGLSNLLENAGAIPLRTAQFIAGKNQSPIRALPIAVGLSRFEMDATLAREFKCLGGELREKQRFNVPPIDGTVYASGRRAQPTARGWRWFGLKVHARNVDLNADLEMHLSRDSYVGVNRIDAGQINICGLFRARPGDASKESKFELLRGAPGSLLRQRLRQAQFDEQSFCSVAGLCLQPQQAFKRNECCVGDALTMIPPVTGNGMSMALESAEMAIEPLIAYARGEKSWTTVRNQIAHACDAAFARRLRWAHRLQTLLFSRWMETGVGSAILRSESVWNFFYSRTR